MLTTSESDELQRLLPVARTARRQHSPSSPQGAASARVTEILAAAHARGDSIRDLSNATGISYHSVARRVRLATGENIGRPAAPRATEEPAPAESPESPESTGEQDVPSDPPPVPPAPDVAEGGSAAAAAPVVPEGGTTAESPSPEPTPAPPEEENPSSAHIFPPDLPNRVEGREVEDVQIPEALAPTPPPAARRVDPFTAGWKR